MKKITLATVKSFIKKNRENLYISFQSHFDGMIDCVTSSNNKTFQKAEMTEEHGKYSQGVKGAWFVGQSRDYFTCFANDGFEGIEVSNSCGSFILAIPMRAA